MSLPELVTLDSVVARNDALVSAAVGAEVVMLHLGNNAYYDVDAIGSDIWVRIETPAHVRDLCAALAEAYDVDRATCERDVLAFLNEALREGLIRVQASPA